MRTYYVRPQCDSGYGAGDGSSYENAWNGFKSVNWDALAGEPATLWVCGDPGGPGGFVTLHVEWSYLKTRPEVALAPEREAKADPHPRREPAVAL
jgi:hypothetical protein